MSDSQEDQKPRANPDGSAIPRKIKLDRLSSEHQEYLRARAVSDLISKQRGYTSIVTEKRLAEYGFNGRQLITPTLLIPIHGVDGKIRFYQHRPDEPRTKYNRVVKFETARGARMALDVHPAMLKRIGNPAIPKVITEGAPRSMPRCQSAFRLLA